MTPNKTSIKEFLQGDKQFVIPVYQRAYSWEESHLGAFLEDLKEAAKAAKGENQYFFGNILLKKTNNEKFDIIDGQQRITTIIIFARALHNVLNSREKDKEMQDFLKYLEEDFLINRDKPKLEAVEYDKYYFEELIILNHTTSKEATTPSQERIKAAKEFFIKNLEKFTNDELSNIFKVLATAEILSITFSNTKDSVLMFELQNNRGKELTKMEKLKSYLSYQIYTYSDKPDYHLKDIIKIFEEIYRIVNDIKDGIKMDEDDILRYFNVSRSGNFDYKEDDYKKELKNSTDKIAWIKDYVRDLKNAFEFSKEFKGFAIYRVNGSNKMQQCAYYLSQLNTNQLIYPFILRAFKLFNNNKGTLIQIFEALEIIGFRNKFSKARSLNSRFGDILKNFESVEGLIEGLKKVIKDEYYWGDENLKSYFHNIFVSNHEIIPYIFVRYENYLRSEEASSRGYFFTLNEIEKPEREHIAPQTESNEELASGYCEYDEEFKKRYLNCLGNLVLISESHNGSNGNKPFAEKLENFTFLSQQKEISNFIVNNGQWDKAAIAKRHEALEKFVLKTWSFEKD